MPLSDLFNARGQGQNDFGFGGQSQGGGFQLPKLGGQFKTNAGGGGFTPGPSPVPSSPPPMPPTSLPPGAPANLNNPNIQQQPPMQGGGMNQMPFNAQQLQQILANANPMLLRYLMMLNRGRF